MRPTTVSPVYGRAWRLALAWILAGLATAWAGHIGFYSGTFDPLHGGHLQVIDRAIDLLHLDAIYLMPNADPPDKPEASPFEVRYEMARLVAARHRAVRLPERELIEQLAKRAPLTYVADLMAEIMRREGPTHTYYQICGTDSFQKMVDKGFLPRPGERRIVAVMARKGYEQTVPAAALPLVAQGRVRFFDPDAPELSSTRLRAIFQAGEEPSAKELPPYLLRFVQRRLLYGASRPRLRIPQGYRAIRGSFPTHSPATGTAVPLASLFPLEVLTDPLTIDIDRYLDQKIPREIQELILSRGLRVMVVGGLLDEALAWLGSQGFEQGTIFVPRHQSRIDDCYIITARQRVPYLVVTNLFGQDRLVQTTLQFGQLLTRNLLPASHLEVYTVADYPHLAERLCREALRRLTADQRTLIVLGYRGALNFVVSDLLKFLEQRGFEAYAKITLEELDRFIAPFGRTHLLQGKAGGNANFPYREYFLPDAAGRLTRIVAFRNLYGDQTGTVLRELVRKGFRQVVLFGNAGALAPGLEIGQVVAPVLVRSGHRVVPVRNAAASDLPAVAAATVPSILVETWNWLAAQQGAQIVEVELGHAAEVLRECPDLQLYAGVLISDRPGVVDLAARDEDSPEFVAAKRTFFFRLLHRIITGAPAIFPRFTADRHPR